MEPGNTTLSQARNLVGFPYNPQELGDLAEGAYDQDAFGIETLQDIQFSAVKLVESWTATRWLAVSVKDKYAGWPPLCFSLSVETPNREAELANVVVSYKDPMGDEQTLGDAQWTISLSGTRPLLVPMEKPLLSRYEELPVTVAYDQAASPMPQMVKEGVGIIWRAMFESRKAGVNPNYDVLRKSVSSYLRDYRGSRASI